MDFSGSKDPYRSEWLAQGRRALSSTVACLKWIRNKRGSSKISPSEYIAESRLVIALDELRKALNTEDAASVPELVRVAEECYVELWSEVRKGRS